MAYFISRPSIFLPSNSGVLPYHQPSHEDRQNGKDNHAVEARADATRQDFAKLNQEHRNHAAKSGEGAMHAVDAAI
jgi:hypothetical protein